MELATEAQRHRGGNWSDGGTPISVSAYKWQGKDLRDKQFVRVPGKGVTEIHFCVPVQRSASRKSLRAVENKRRETKEERKES
jgi:hypothetical protein